MDTKTKATTTEHAGERQASFTRFDECSKQDAEIILENYTQFAQEIPTRVLDHLRLLDGDFGGFNIDRLQHSLQTATRALRDGRDEEYVVCALLHDIGDTLGTYDHGGLAAAILKPFVGCCKITRFSKATTTSNTWAEIKMLAKSLPTIRTMNTPKSLSNYTICLPSTPNTTACR
jgi:predicted HD phosphohydrolase